MFAVNAVSLYLLTKLARSTDLPIVVEVSGVAVAVVAVVAVTADVTGYFYNVRKVAVWHIVISTSNNHIASNSCGKMPPKMQQEWVHNKL